MLKSIKDFNFKLWLLQVFVICVIVSNGSCESVAVSRRAASIIEPEWRGFHSSVIINDKLLIYGGIASRSQTSIFQESGTTALFVFDLVNKTWSTPKMQNSPSQPAKFHTATSIVSSNNMYVYNGLDQSHPSSIMILNTDLWNWVYSSVTALPSSRIGQTMSSYRQKVYLYGGMKGSQEGKPNSNSTTDELGYFDTAAQSWTPQSNGNQRSLHASCISEEYGYMINFGGIASEHVSDNQDNSVFIHRLSPPSWFLNLPFQSNGFQPSARIGATLTCIGKKAVLFGGGNYQTMKPIDSQVYILDISNLIDGNPKTNEYSWSKPAIGNLSEGPSARFGHSASIKDNNIYIYGGIGAANDNNLYILDTVNWSWSKMITNGTYNNTNYSNESEDNLGSDVSGSNGIKRHRAVIITATLSALFGIVAMGIIVAVGIANWKRKTNKPKDYASTHIRSCTSRDDNSLFHTGRSIRPDSRWTSPSQVLNYPTSIVSDCFNLRPNSCTTDFGLNVTTHASNDTMSINPNYQYPSLSPPTSQNPTPSSIKVPSIAYHELKDSNSPVNIPNTSHSPPMTAKDESDTESESISEQRSTQFSIHSTHLQLSNPRHNDLISRGSLKRHLPVPFKASTQAPTHFRSHSRSESVSSSSSLRCSSSTHY